MFALCLIDFWGIGRTNAQQENIFMESYSGFKAEDYEHSIGDTYKIIELMSSSLNTMLRRRQDCKLSSVITLAVYGIQCIKSNLTLIKTTLNPLSDLFKVVGLRSASIPTAWSQRLGMTKVFELIVCSHVGRTDLTM
ncbi:hypothetical protein INT48_001691 [Thamnidium elegans]|uniref:Uncharacterized protein n=1 Tax=Thamnidium elegans TaxID=101142 RepID=A0A8H7VVR9_9FUNG|nr:hypothetical protein INT48_001691 [Thamnidium elegans]